MGLKIALVVGIVVVLVVVGVVIMYDDQQSQSILTEQEGTKSFTKPGSIRLALPSQGSSLFGMDAKGRFHNNDGLQYQNASGGFMRVYDSEGNFIRSVGFGITSNQYNRSVSDLSWEWQYIETTNISFVDVITNKTVQEEEPVHQWIATYTSDQGVWTQVYDFHPTKQVKITHTIENKDRRLTDVKMWYIMTINDDEIAKYDGEEYNLDQDRKIKGSKGNLNERIPKIEFPNDIFDFSDVLKEYNVTDVHVGDASMFGLPDQRILAIGISGKARTDFPNNRNATVDPTITINTQDTGSTVNNVTIENNFTHLNITTNDPFDSLITYFPFDTNTSSTVYDYSDENDDGTPETCCTGQTPWWNDSGYYGGGMIFVGDDGTNNRVTIPASGQTAVNELTILAWWNGVHDDDWATFWMIPGSEKTALHYSSTNNLRYTWDNGVEWGINTGLDIPDNQWAFVGVTVNSTTAIVYLGNATALQTYENIQAHSTIDLTSTARIGRDFSGRNLNGTMDELMVFTTDLSFNQVQGIYNGSIERFYERGYQQFDNLNVSGDGTENRLNVSLNQLLNYSNVNLTVQVGDVSGSSYSYGSETQVSTTTGNASDITISTPNNISLRVNFYADTQDFYMPVLQHDLILDSFFVAAAGGDTCTYTSGNWEIDCSDSCVTNQTYDLSGNNITATGSGTLRFELNVTNVDVFTKANACTVIKPNGVIVG